MKVDASWALALAFLALGAEAQPTSTSTAAGGQPPALGVPVERDGWTADRVAQRAVQVAPSVHQAVSSAETADRVASLAVAAFAPRLDLRASYGRISEVTQQPISFGGTTFELFPQFLDSYGLRASLSIPLSDYFFTRLPSFKQARHLARAAAFQAEAERESVALRARETFYGYLRARAAERVADDAVAQLEAYLVDLELLVGAGEGTQADVLQARSRLSEARVQQSAARGGVRLLAHQLAVLLDLPPGSPFAVGESVFDARPPDAPAQEALLETAMTNRPEARALDALADGGDARVRAVWGQRLPRLAVVGNVDYSNPNPRQIPQRDEFTGTWDVGVVLSWSPNDFVANLADTDQARLERTRVENDRATLADALGVTSAQAAIDYRVALETIAAADGGVSAASEAWRVRRDLLAAGEATPSEVLDAETALRRAQLQQIDAHVAARLAYARVQHVIGKSRFEGDRR